MTDNLDGNEAQNRMIARQLFSAWSQDQEATTKKSFLDSSSVPAWVACFIAVATVIAQAAITRENVAQARSDIAQLENDRREDMRVSQLAIERMARMEAKLDILAGAEE